MPNQTITANQTPAVERPEGQKPNLQPRSATGWLNAGVLVTLLAINLVCFYRTLNGYFVADDFIHVAYLSNVFNGHAHLLLENFTSNWMQTHGTQFYRPLVSLSMALDYWLGAGSAMFFHITNTLLQVASAFFLFLLTSRLLSSSGTRRWSSVAAFTTAALFSVYPLHAEVVSWAIGRVDSLCTMFYLAAFWLFLKGRQERSRMASASSFVCFILGLLSKEMAITLPATLALCCLFDESEGGGKLYFGQRLRVAVRDTWLFWTVLGGYLLVRLAALGTLFGGYSGAIGEAQANSFLKRWLLDGSLRRIFFPLNVELFGPTDKTARLLLYVYGAAGALLAARAAVFRLNLGLSRYLMFAGLWFVVAMLPTYQVWNLTENLQGSRFIYLGSAPLCLTLALLMVPLFKALGRYQRWLSLAGATCALVLIVIWGAIAYKDNLAWAHAFAHTRDFRSAIAERVAQLPSGKKLVLLNVPQKEEGAHMIYNGSMLDILLRPPLTSTDISRRVISFEPMTYGFPDLVAPTRLRALSTSADRYDFVSWNRKTHKLQPLTTSPAASQAVHLDISSLTPQLTLPGVYGKTAKLVSPRLNVPAMAYDIVRVRLRVSPAATDGKPVGIYLFWNGTSDLSYGPERMLSLPVVADGSYHDYLFQVSEHKSWLAANRIEKILIELPFVAGKAHTVGNSPLLSVESVSLEPLSAPRVIPSSVNLRADEDGVYRNTGWPIAFEITGASPSTALVEVSRESAWFEHYTGTYRDQAPSAQALKQFRLSPPNNRIVLEQALFPSSGYYQLRAFSLDEQGKVQGFACDPVNLQLTK